MQWFKTITTNEYIRMVKQNLLPSFDKRTWQRNYKNEGIDSNKKRVSKIGGQK